MAACSSAPTNAIATNRFARPVELLKILGGSVGSGANIPDHSMVQADAEGDSRVPETWKALAIPSDRQLPGQSIRRSSGTPSREVVTGYTPPAVSSQRGCLFPEPNHG